MALFLYHIHSLGGERDPPTPAHTISTLPSSKHMPNAVALLSTPPPVIATQKYGINTVPTPTGAWTRAWLARDTYNCQHTRE